MFKLFLLVVSSFLIPADAAFNHLHCAFDPILVTDKEESIAGREEELNKVLDKKYCLSVIEITFVAIYSLISALIVSMIGKQEMVDLAFLNVPNHALDPALSSKEEWMLNTSLG